MTSTSGVLSQKLTCFFHEFFSHGSLIVHFTSFDSNSHLRALLPSQNTFMYIAELTLTQDFTQADPFSVKLIVLCCGNKTNVSVPYRRFFQEDKCCVTQDEVTTTQNHTVSLVRSLDPSHFCIPLRYQVQRKHRINQPVRCKYTASVTSQIQRIQLQLNASRDKIPCSKYGQ